MSETKHSPEPWVGGLCADDIDDADGDLVAESMTPGDRRRALACVNACAGIPTEALEHNTIARLIDGAVVVAQGLPAPHKLISALAALGRLP